SSRGSRADPERSLAKIAKPAKKNQRLRSEDLQIDEPEFRSLAILASLRESFPVLTTKNPAGLHPRGFPVPQLPWGQLLAAIRRPEPGGTAVYVTSWPDVAAIARSVESAMFGLPSSGSQVPLATS